ncbi:NAD(P)/FAD-dependent oxidoreductase [Teredinibacter turnerae]|uniref:NAD(P)/FAD-dependent oxidoreductase n=1 Tax=Teredinibacter turnerae TaxID=2426 RepID=UPI000364156C|nr:NAD(P)/FAD-dependent oxidoreductase [Teredinibacter turnerae]
MQNLDVVIVGAGPAGIGMAMELGKVPGLQFGVLESDRTGESFRRWPTQTRLITPSFYSNPFGLADLNSIDATTSPAAFAGAEHLSGVQYADYLKFVADTAQLPIVCGCKVLEVNPDPDGGFHIVTELGELFTQFLIWACGEYQFPNLNPFPGANLCYHYAHIEDWQSLQPIKSLQAINNLESRPYIVIGGYESGLVSAINLVKLGHQVRLLVRRPTWDLPDETDPSLVLSPYTRERLRQMESNDKLEIVYDANVIEVTHNEDGSYRVHSANGCFWDTEQPPILGTGFLKGGGAIQIKDLWIVG